MFFFQVSVLDRGVFTFKSPGLHFLRNICTFFCFVFYQFYIFFFIKKKKMFDSFLKVITIKMIKKIKDRIKLSIPQLAVVTNKGEMRWLYKILYASRGERVFTIK